MWHNLHAHLRDEIDVARFLLQVDASPYATAVHDVAMANDDDPLMGAATTPDFAALLTPLPFRLLYELALGPAVWLAAQDTELDGDQLDVVAESCWRAITTPSPPPAHSG